MSPAHVQGLPVLPIPHVLMEQPSVAVIVFSPRKTQTQPRLSLRLPLLLLSASLPAQAPGWGKTMDPSNTPIQGHLMFLHQDSTHAKTKEQSFMCLQQFYRHHLSNLPPPQDLDLYVGAV